MISIKTEKEQNIMREGGQILALILNELKEKTLPGVKRNELENLAKRLCLKYKVRPSFLGYNDYPGALCVSLNNEVVHGLPISAMIKKRDLVSLDMGVFHGGLHTDSAVSFICGGGKNSKVDRLIKATEQSFYAGIDKIKDGVRLGDVSAAIEAVAERHSFGVIRMLVGHGIGKKVHEDPHIPNYGMAGTGPVLRTGMTLAIEPMFTMSGVVDVILLDDKWTYVTTDGSLASHYEHTVLVKKDGCEVLTKLK